jgi:ABC-type Fe3+/spermidine/putrescine transport system ATPase subunit
MLEVQNLYKSYLPQGEISISGCGTSLVEKNNQPKEKKSDFAVEDISFSLFPEKILAVLGENGSGKSTLLKILAGLLDPDLGKVLLNGEAVLSPSQKLVAGHPKIKLIHQNYNLFPNISLAENILYPLRFFAKSYQQEKLAELLKLCHLQKVKDKLPKQCSGGEQQRCAIANALATETEILLLDEPFSNLDIFNRNELKTHISHIAKEASVGIMFVTHDAQDALSVADEIMVVKDGKIIERNSPKNMYFHPKHIYTAQITGLANIWSKNEFQLSFSSYFSENTLEKEFNHAILRPEFISVGDAGIGVAVIDCFFYGNTYLCSAKLLEEVSIQFYSLKSFETAQKIYLKMDFEDIYFI